MTRAHTLNEVCCCGAQFNMTVTEYATNYLAAQVTKWRAEHRHTEPPRLAEITTTRPAPGAERRARLAAYRAEQEADRARGEAAKAQERAYGTEETPTDD